MESADASGQPVNFGKRLAHTDKVVRDRGFRVLKKWLQKHPELTRLEFMKLWKGLYFGMWMADKRPVQQELAVNVALLLTDVPTPKRAMWIDTFWETMQNAWEKLDVHRINKYLLFVRIVIAEAFKSVRLASWPTDDMRALGNTFTRAIPMSAKEGPNAPSLGLLLQFTRIFWEELRPQLEASNAVPKQAVLDLLEPFCILSEGSAHDSLVRHIHEYIFRKAPRELFTAIMVRILAGAAKTSVTKKNRQALYDTADALERIAATPAPNDKPVIQIRETAGASAEPAGNSSAGSSVVASLMLPAPMLPLDEAQGASESKKKTAKKPKAKGKRPKKRKESGDSCVSPLMLPESMLPLDESEGANEPPRKRKKKQDKRKSASAE